MTFSRTRNILLTALLLSLFYLLPSTRADPQIPALSPLELNVELGNLDVPGIGPELHAYHNLAEDEAPKGTHMHQKRYGSGAPYWFSQIKRQGKVAYGNSSYIIWRNVQDYGAKGDGITDDTDAINNASADGSRCGLGCDSSTVLPAIVYFPAGTYLVSAPLIQYYYTQFVGDANNLPTLLASSEFYGIGVIDTDVYLPYGYSWWTNQNNFYRHIRHFVIDLTQVPPTRSVHGIHWQTSQAASLQNIVFNMVMGTLGDGNQQQGIFQDNGSGLLMEDMIFNGGGTGLFAGNQQMTVRNLTFNGCETAIFQNWNWVYAYKSITINNCGVGYDMTQGGDVPAVGSTTFQDSTFNHVQYGILTSFKSNSTPTAAGTLVLDNVNFINTDPAIMWENYTAITPGNRRITSFVQGMAYTAYEDVEVIQGLSCYQPTVNYSRIQQLADPAPKSASLLTPSGTVYERSRPQYEGVPVESFISVIDYGCVGDGLADDTVCVQNFMDSIQDGQIAYIDHGAYLISDTIQVPNDIKILGEVWSMFMIDGSSSTFSDMSNPQVAFRVGNPGDTGTVEMSDLVFETRGSAPGAIIMEWNLAGTEPTATGMWDVHWRIGGSAGTLLQSDTCTRNEKVSHGANPNCIGAFLLLHLTSTSSLIMSHNWLWVSDHELDLTDHNQIDIYNGRGLLCESQGPVWIYGSGVEHNQLYNYQFANSKDIYISIVQSETAYVPQDHTTD